ncbi:MAG: hypothetical protein LJE87_17765 [Deltaproteobacteria bacterium]|jgi:hypothetical protein|nr:hypothetical protein [Deltaproteobacteria bacterium]
MSNYLETELQRIIEIAEENAEISSEYTFKFFRIFLTASEARDILEIIQNHKEYQFVQSRVAN